MEKTGDNRVTPEEHKLEQVKALANEIKEMAISVLKKTSIAYPPKRIFRKKDRRPLKRIKRQRAMIALGMAPGIARMRLLMIMSQPIPKFPYGGGVPIGQAIVGEFGHEQIITPKGLINVSANQHPHPHFLPPGAIRPVPGIDTDPNLPELPDSRSV